ncbi:DUF3990 domain-containing protein [Candidatus Saccharibacteria bacterium]|nr:DUF3990 domain-containing protein [Candidatus Saccharibacteria bacterium]
MILYHGTNADFGEIDLAKSKPNKDFGQGFYLSREYTQAMDMAKTKVEQLESGSPIVLTYEVDDNAMARLKVLRFDDYSEEWAKFILLNRNNASREPAHDYDIVIGPIANDRVGVQLWKYENHSIDLPTLVHNLRNMRGITFQYYFGTERAVKILRRL